MNIDQEDKLRVRLGEMIALMRTRKGLSRTKLLNLLDRELEEQDTKSGLYGEAWLARLERGQVVKVGRPVLESIIRALDCTSAERVSLLLAADRNILQQDGNQQDKAKNFLALATFTLANDKNVRLITRVLENKQRNLSQLTDKEVLILLSEAIEIALHSQH